MKKITLKRSGFNAFIPLLMAVILFNCSLSYAQNNTVYFQDEVITMPNNIASFNWNTMPESAKFDNGYFAWVRFSETPVQAIQDQFAQRNLKLIEYFPDKTYLVHFPADTEIAYLQDSGVISIIPIENDFKKSSDIKLNNIDSYAIEGNNVVIMAEYYDFIDRSFISRELSKMNTVVVKELYEHGNYAQIAIPYNQINTLVSKPFIKWVELTPPPAVFEDTRGRGIHRSSNLDTQSLTGRNYTGDGVGLMVRDDGVIGPHIDFQGRLTSFTNSNGGSHGDGVAGIMAGAGNLDPDNRGMAAGSQVYAVVAAVSFLDNATVNSINTGQVHITNNSYGTVCNGGYTAAARTVDEQISSIPSALHVFSAGNSGLDNCGYGAGAGWGNITGGAKQGKNAIATANTFFNGQLVNSSSRGPAYDGRIKPDIAAYGQGQVSTDGNNTYQSFGGTSGAAPGIAGVAAQLYEAYADANGGTLPDSGLIKAAMLNTANDYGNVGPDYGYGWGIVNGLRAAMLIEEGRFLDATVSQGNSNTHQITVPANTREVRVMLYWDDVPANSGVATALVNDLDVIVTDPNTTTHQPWVLDTTPNGALLNFPATRGTDRLNNMEQVLIENPAAGTYDVDVTGFNVPFGPQKYHVVYEIITDALTLTYPMGGEKMVTGSQEVIHWDSQGLTGNNTIQLSDDNGATWSNISVVPSATTNFTWAIPNNLVSGECMIRITNGSFTSQSMTFSVARRITNVNITQICPDGVTVTWTGIPGVSSYDIYLLGDRFMEVAGTSTTTSATIPVPNPLEPVWVAVSAKGNNGWESLRSDAVNVSDGGLFNCPLSKDIAVNTINNTENDFNDLCSTAPIIISANIENGGTDPQSNFTISYQIGSEPVVQETYTNTLGAGAAVVYDFTTPATLTTNGDTTLRVWTSLVGDEFAINNERTLDFTARVTGTVLNFEEDFEASNLLPDDWLSFNPDNQFGWEFRDNIIGVDGNNTRTLFMDGFAYGSIGQQDILTTEYFNLTTAPDATLLFDVAKAQYNNANNDGLRVEISTDCGLSYTQIYFKDGSTLATVPNTTSAWAPAAGSDWRTETVSLDAYLGSNVLLRFTHVNGFSNNTYIDNIRVESTLSVAENNLNDAISMFPNPASNEVNVLINTTIGNTYEMELLNSIGQTISKIQETRFNATAQQKLNVGSLGAGLYFVKIKIGDQMVTKKLIVN